MVQGSEERGEPVDAIGFRAPPSQGLFLHREAISHDCEQPVEAVAELQLCGGQIRERLSHPHDGIQHRNR